MPAFKTNSLTEGPPLTSGEKISFNLFLPTVQFYHSLDNTWSAKMLEYKCCLFSYDVPLVFEMNPF